LMVTGQGLGALWNPAPMLFGTGIVMTVLAVVAFTKRLA